VYVVTGSVIGVFLLSLAVGYMLGGRLSKRIVSSGAELSGVPGFLGINLMIAGGWVCAMPFFIEPICDGIFQLGLDERWGSLFASVSLFGVPTVLLGTVSPTAVHWLTHHAGQAGENTGLVLAFSTVASFAGCVVTAFYLVVLSIRRTLIVSGVVLAGLGCVILFLSIMRARQENQRQQKQFN